MNRIVQGTQPAMVRFMLEPQHFIGRVIPWESDVAMETVIMFPACNFTGFKGHPYLPDRYVSIAELKAANEGMRM